MLLVGAFRFEGRFCVSKKGGVGGGEVGGHIQDMPCTWQLPWLAVEWLWSTLAGPFFILLAQMGVETTPPLVRAPFLEL